MTPRIVILAAPSGTGKTTITRALLQRRPDAGFSVSATTRPPRPGERDGVDYHFLPPEEFQRRVAAGDFLEWAEYAGNRYGTLRGEVDRILGAGKHALLDIEIQGARQVQEQRPAPQSLGIFILPPSGRELIRRLKARGTDSGDRLARRLDRAVVEIRDSLGWEHIVVNDDLQRALEEINRIIDEDGTVPHRPSAMQPAELVRELVSEADSLRRGTIGA